MNFTILFNVDWLLNALKFFVDVKVKNSVIHLYCLTFWVQTKQYLLLRKITLMMNILWREYFFHFYYQRMTFPRN